MTSEIPPIPADYDGMFTLADGSRGNPGCDICGSYDARIKHDGTFYCQICYRQRDTTPRQVIASAPVDTRSGLQTVAEVVAALDELYQWDDEADDYSSEEFEERELELLRDLYEVI